MKDLRNDTDYGYGGPDADIAAMAAKTTMFVNKTNELLDS
jgi:hypothetical protein